MIGALTPKCLEFAKDKDNFVEHLVIASLAGKRAKIWIEENALEGLEGQQINYAPWVDRANAASAGSIGDMAERSKAKAGVLAPIGEHLEIKGGWVFPDGTECFDPTKERRDKDIHDYGFS